MMSITVARAWRGAAPLRVEPRLGAAYDAPPPEGATSSGARASSKIRVSLV